MSIYPSQNRDVNLYQICLEQLIYNPEDGLFIWKQRENSIAFNRQFSGKQAGHINKKGYCIIGIRGSSYKAHHIAWLMTYGVLPTKQVDHIDRNKVNNAISNLRELEPVENCANKTYFIGKSGIAGLRIRRSKNGKKWRALSQVNGTLKSIGVFDTIEEARQAHLIFIASQPTDIKLPKKKKKPTQIPTQDLVKLLFIYEPETGFFYSRRNGKKYRSVNHMGYPVVNIDGKNYSSHRIAFLYMTGSLPPKDMVVDHINHIRDDNRFENLRVVTTAENMLNISRDPFAGNHLHQNPSGNWNCRITLFGKRHSAMQTFPTEKEARFARLDLIEKVYAEFLKPGEVDEHRQKLIEEYASLE